jgi:hypothetical protein
MWFNFACKGFAGLWLSGKKTVIAKRSQLSSHCFSSPIPVSEVVARSLIKLGNACSSPTYFQNET